MATVPPNRRIERAGVNALRTLLEDEGHVVQEIAGSADHGEDCFVMLVRGGERTGYACTVQVKAGKKYKRAHGYAINVGHHGKDWRSSKLPVIGVVYDLDEQRLFWINLTQQLSTAPSEPSWVAIPRENELHAGSLDEFCTQIEEFTDSSAAHVPSAQLPASAPKQPMPRPFRTPQQLWQHTTGVPATRQPRVTQGHVVVRQGHRLLVLDAASGVPRWSKQTAFDWDGPAGDGAVFVSASGGRLRALGVAQGRQRWERPLRVRDELMAYAAQRLYAPTVRGAVYALDSRGGEVVWVASADAGPLAAPVVAHDDQILTLRAGAEGRAPAPTGRVVALRTADGTECWGYLPEAPLSVQWAVDEGVLYVVERPDSGSSMVVALQAHTGRRLWNALVPEPVASAPAVSGGFVYVVGGHGGLFQLRCESGEQRRFSAAPSPTASAVVADGVVMVNQGRSLVAFDAVTGEQRWRKRLSGLATGQPFVAGPAVYLAHRVGLAAHGFSSSGRRLWSSEVTWEAETQGEPVVVDDVLYLTDRRGVVRAFSVSS